MVPHLLVTKTLSNDNRLDEVDLEEGLEVEVGDLLPILHTEELGELGIRENAALEVGVKAVVRLDVGGDELGHIRLGALALGRQAHEGGQLIRNRAELEERVVRTARLVDRLLLRGHVGGVLAATLLGVAGLALDRLGRLERLMNCCADASSYIRAERLEGILESGEDCIRGADLNRGSDLSGRDNNSCGGSHGDSDLRLRGTLASGLGLSGGGGCGSSYRGGLGLLINSHFV